MIAGTRQDKKDCKRSRCRSDHTNLRARSNGDGRFGHVLRRTQQGGNDGNVTEADTYRARARREHRCHEHLAQRPPSPASEPADARRRRGARSGQREQSRGLVALHRGDGAATQPEPYPATTQLCACFPRAERGPAPETRLLAQHRRGDVTFRAQVCHDKRVAPPAQGLDHQHGATQPFEPPSFLRHGGGCQSTCLPPCERLPPTLVTPSELRAHLNLAAVGFAEHTFPRAKQFGATANVRAEIAQCISIVAPLPR
eukprot:6173040-Pleurochrysis_carterae.AAC.3